GGPVAPGGISRNATGRRKCGPPGRNPVRQEAASCDGRYVDTKPHDDTIGDDTADPGDTMTGDTMRDKTRDRTREDDALVEVGNYPTTLDGAVDRARLLAAGIEAVLFDTEMATNWVYTNAIGGV